MVRPGQIYRVLVTIFQTQAQPHPIDVRASILRNGVDTGSQIKTCHPNVQETLMIQVSVEVRALRTSLNSNPSVFFILKYAFVFALLILSVTWMKIREIADLEFSQVSTSVWRVAINWNEVWCFETLLHETLWLVIKEETWRSLKLMRTLPSEFFQRIFWEF